LFRLATLFALLFLTLTGALILAVLWIVEGTQRSTLISANQADIATVRNGYREEGLDEAIEVVRQRLGTPDATARHRHALAPDAYMVIESARGEAVIGNLPVVTCQEGNFRVTLPAAGERGPERRLLGVCADIGDGATLFVGRDVAALAATRERILGAFTWIALGTCALAVVAGLYLGRRFMGRVDAITQTCERIIAGHLDERIPLRGRGDEWDRLAQAINDMLDRISALMENLRQVSSDVAHDLRTPLTRLRNRLEQARSGSSRMEDYSVAVSRAINDTDQLLSIFSALLRISQVEAGTRAQTFRSVCLTELLEKIYQLYLPVAEDCHHALSCTLAEGVHIRGDAELLTQLFSNLIENALHHTPAGTPIRVTLEWAQGRPLAAVTDGGSGIPAHEREKVLRRFYRLSSSRSTEGNGLGLSLVSAIAELHGATIELQDAQPGLRVSVLFRQEST
jgi:signal transduction histidine kinase